MCVCRYVLCYLSKQNVCAAVGRRIDSSVGTGMPIPYSVLLAASCFVKVPSKEGYKVVLVCLLF